MILKSKIRLFLPLLSLLLLYASCATHPPAKGFLVDVAKVPPPVSPTMWCGDASRLVATAAGNGRVRLNSQAGLSLDGLVTLVRQILIYHAEKVVYVSAEPQASWGDFIAMVDRLWPEVEVVSILTPHVGRDPQAQFCLAPSCGRCENFRTLRTR